MVLPGIYTSLAEDLLDGFSSLVNRLDFLCLLDDILSQVVDLTMIRSFTLVFLFDDGTGDPDGYGDDNDEDMMTTTIIMMIAMSKTCS